MVLPDNILPGVPDPSPPGSFLVPVCTNAEGVRLMIYALDTAYKMSGNVNIIKDFLNGLKYISDPENSPCMPDGTGEAPEITIETDGDCQRVLIDGVAATDWICPPDPEQPPIEPTVGTLGYTVSELECMVMACINIAGMLKVEKGVIYAKDDCCQWVAIEGQAGALLQSGTTAPGEFGVDEWVDQGSPDITPSLPVPHDNPLYQTQDSLKCAKATAIVNEIWNVLTIGEAVREAGEIATIATVAAEIGSILTPLKWGTRIGFTIASAIWSLITGVGFDEYADSMQEVYEDDESKNELICDLVNRMVSPVQVGPFLANKMTAADVQAALDRFDELVPHDSVVRTTLGLFPISSWIEVVGGKVPETDCGCEQYLPFVPSEIPSGLHATAEAVNGRHMGQGTPATYAEVFAGVDGIFEGDGVWQWGAVVSDDPTSEYELGALIVFSDMVQLNNIVISTTSDVTLRADATNNGFRVWSHDKVNLAAEWDLTHDGNLQLPGIDEPLNIATGGADVRAIYLGGHLFENVAGAAPAHPRTTIKVSGQYGGQTFTLALAPF